MYVVSMHLLQTVSNQFFHYIRQRGNKHDGVEPNGTNVQQRSKAAPTNSDSDAAGHNGRAEASQSKNKVTLQI